MCKEGSPRKLSEDFAHGWGSTVICVERVRELDPKKREEEVCLRMGSSEANSKMRM